MNEDKQPWLKNTTEYVTTSGQIQASVNQDITFNPESIDLDCNIHSLHKNTIKCLKKTVSVAPPKVHFEIVMRLVLLNDCSKK